MKSRCYVKSNQDYHSYGAKGVRICDRWMDFWNFVSDMGPKPSPNHSIDRIDSSGDYKPSNCRWATSSQQSFNTSRNRFIEFQGRRMTICQWADEIGLSRESMRDRVGRGVLVRGVFMV